MRPCARWALVAAIALARVGFGYQFQALASLAPELVDRFGLGYAALGGLIGLYMAPGILVALPGGLLGFAAATASAWSSAPASPSMTLGSNPAGRRRGGGPPGIGAWPAPWPAPAPSCWSSCRAR